MGFFFLSPIRPKLRLRICFVKKFFSKIYGGQWKFSNINLEGWGILSLEVSFSLKSIFSPCDEWKKMVYTIDVR